MEEDKKPKSIIGAAETPRSTRPSPVEDQVDDDEDDNGDVEEEGDDDVPAAPPEPEEPEEMEVVAFERFEKGSKTVDVDHFKLNVAMMKRNTSWKYRKPTIVEMEHAHIYHTHSDATLRENKHCSPTGGHFHEVKVTYGKNAGGGKVIKKVECGPPLRWENVRLDDETMVKQAVQVRWPKRVSRGGDDGVKSVWVNDEHRHTFTYLGGETISQNERQSYRAGERKKVNDSMSGPPVMQAARLNSLQNGPEKDKVRHNLHDAPERKEPTT